MGGKGPAPKPANLRRRRRPTPGFRLLPHEGRTEQAPEWPLDVPPTDVEWAEWKRLWSLPQAVEWERIRCEPTVALYVRTFIEAALPGAKVELLTAVRLLDDKIGLSPAAMQKLRWETDEPIEEEDEAEDQPQPRSTRAYIPKKEDVV